MKTISLIVLSLLCAIGARARDTYNFNSGWQIDIESSKLKAQSSKLKVQSSKLKAQSSKFKVQSSKNLVTLPHAWNEDEAFRVSTYETSTGVVWYRKTFKLPEDSEGKKVFIEFEGARQAAEVWLNGSRVGLSENGAVAFGFDLTPYIKKGKNLIEVKTDNSWDYKEQATGTLFQWNYKAFNVSYGGLNRNVWLHITPMVYQTLPLFSNLGTTGVYVYGRDYSIPERTATICVESQVRNETDEPVRRSLNVSLTPALSKGEGENATWSFTGEAVTIPAHGMATLKAEKRISGLHFWSWGYGYLYDVETSLSPASPLNPLSKGEGRDYCQDLKRQSSAKHILPSPLERGLRGEAGVRPGLKGEADVVTTRTGFRKTEFKRGQFYLNDRVMMLHGYAQRTTNEWPGVGPCVPAWMSDYSNGLMVKSGGNIVRWMHTCPWRQDVESCDRVGLIEAMPAADAEYDTKGRQWEMRLEVMRDAIVYNRNNPSIIFYESGNKGVSPQHLREMKALRDQFDPDGGRAIGCRDMLDNAEAEYGGEMLYVNKSDTKPMWMMEYCRDEANRFYWNSWSYPFHKEGAGPLHRGSPAKAYNHNNDEFAAELVRRWYGAWLERPGSGTKVSAGGAKIVFSDTQSHGRSADNYRVSGVVDPMRIEKDAFYATQVMWDGWVDDLKPHTYIVGHWQYDRGFTVPVVYVVSNADSVVLRQNGKTIRPDSHKYRFLWTFKNVKVESDSIEALSLAQVRGGAVKYKAGAPARLKLTPIENPTGWKADGNDIALVQAEVVDKDGRRCPLDNRVVKWSVKGPAEYLGGIAMNKPFGMNTNSAALESKSSRDPGPVSHFDARTTATLNHARCDTLPVECGISRVMLRSLAEAGKVTVIARAEGLPDATVELSTSPIAVVGGLSAYKPSDGLQPVLDRGETPASPSYRQWRREVAIVSARAGGGNDPTLSFDTYEDTEWASDAQSDSAWIAYTLCEKAKIDEICMKTGNFRSTTYPLAVYADGVRVWEGWTSKTLGYVHIPLTDAPAAQVYTIRMRGDSKAKDAFGMIREMDGKNDEKKSIGGKALRIVEVEFLKNL